MNIELVKAIFNAGFEKGFDAGADFASSHEWGEHYRGPRSGESYWLEYQQFDFKDPVKFEDLQFWNNL